MCGIVAVVRVLPPREHVDDDGELVDALDEHGDRAPAAAAHRVNDGRVNATRDAAATDTAGCRHAPSTAIAATAHCPTRRRDALAPGRPTSLTSALLRASASAPENRALASRLPAVLSAIARRGPDHLGERSLEVERRCGRARVDITASTLSLRGRGGVRVPGHGDTRSRVDDGVDKRSENKRMQPRESQRFVLAFNGELYYQWAQAPRQLRWRRERDACDTSGADAAVDDSNDAAALTGDWRRIAPDVDDTQLLLDALERAAAVAAASDGRNTGRDSSKHDGFIDDALVPSVMARFRGPFAIVVFDRATQRMYFGRDPHGRRSLLLRTARRAHDDNHNGDGGGGGGDDDDNSDDDDKNNNNNKKRNDRNRTDNSDWTDDNIALIVASACDGDDATTAASACGDWTEIPPVGHSLWCVVIATMELSLARPSYASAHAALRPLVAMRALRSHAPRSGNRGSGSDIRQPMLDCTWLPPRTTRCSAAAAAAAAERGAATHVDIATAVMIAGDQYVREFAARLHEAVRVRAEARPAGCSVGVLFSGGIDSMVIACLLDACLSHVDRASGESVAIELINVAFTQDDDDHVDAAAASPAHRRQQRHHGAASETAGATSGATVPDAPDSLTAREGLSELRRRTNAPRPRERFRLVSVRASRADTVRDMPRVRALMHPTSSTAMDESIGACLWYAAAGASPSVRILFSGLGADELLGGYKGRHRTRFRQGGRDALRDELDGDVARLWWRNLGRDDRCAADHGRELRHPFLDDAFAAWITKCVPLDAVCDLTRPDGDGDKMILRRAARDVFGLSAAAAARPKRAMQFGSRAAKVVGSQCADSAA